MNYRLNSKFFDDSIGGTVNKAGEEAAASDRAITLHHTECGTATQTHPRAEDNQNRERKGLFGCCLCERPHNVAGDAIRC
jgi:hypothetical protein